MPMNTAFYQSLHCLLRQNQSSDKEYNIIFFFFLKNPVTSKIYNGPSHLTQSDLTENVIGLQRVKVICLMLHISFVYLI